MIGWLGGPEESMMAHEHSLITVGQALPSIILPTLDGQPFDLASLRGKRVLLFMWGSW